MENNKIFAIKFEIREGKIATKMSSKNLQPHEKIGLLEIAKRQVMDEVSKNRRDIFRGVKKDE